MPIQKADRKEVIRAALNIFHEKGYSGARMTEIAASCGLQKGSLYHYFPSKEALMKEVIRSLHDHYKRTVFSISEQHTLSGAEKLKLLAKRSEEIFIEQHGGSLMANIGLESASVWPQFSKPIRAFYKDWINCMTTIFADKYPPDWARELAEQSIAELEGAVMLMQLYGKTRFLLNAHAGILRRYNQAE